MVAQTGQSYVTIQRAGRTIAFNEAAFVALGRPEALELLYDRGRSIVGLRAASKDAEHAYQVRHNTRGTTHMVSGELFTKYYGITADVARRWRGVMEGDVLCVDLAKPGAEVASRQGAGLPSQKAGANR